MDISKTFKILIVAAVMVFSANCNAQLTLKAKNTEAILYLGKSINQPLIVGLGGSEGGNAWASDYWKPTRDQFIAKGYAFLAVGYFGVNGAPAMLDKIAIEDIHGAIAEAVKNKSVDKNRIAIVGGSRGADLALLTASYYKDIKCVVALVASHVVFPGNTDHLSASSWTYESKELPFVPVSEEAVPFLMKRDLRGAFETMLKDTAAEEKAVIKVENIKGPVLLISATRDEICPSTPMAEKIMKRLDEKNFKFYKEHVAIDGGHGEPLKHFDLVFAFLAKHFTMK
ncbi:MAG: hypothetical protein EOO95_08590 [Pedobacter sp.]|nr:MAG: hypothetical protein EOO95_08590 [Pedobacter sp.]